jgi:hypothetical protein
MKNQSLKISAFATPLMIICGLLVSGVSARADSDDKGCSNNTLRGDYGFAVEGVILPAPGVALPLRGVHMTHFSGNGTLTQVDHIVVDGVSPTLEWTPVTGTYHVNADCTGTITLVPSNSPVVNLIIVVVRQGREIHTVVTAPFNGPDRTVTSFGIKVE